MPKRYLIKQNKPCFTYNQTMWTYVYHVYWSLENGKIRFLGKIRKQNKTKQICKVEESKICYLQSRKFGSLDITFKSEKTFHLYVDCIARLVRT